MTFHSVGNGIIPTDEVIFFRGVGIPPTSFCCHRKMGNVVFGEEKLFFWPKRRLKDDKNWETLCYRHSNMLDDNRWLLLLDLSNLLPWELLGLDQNIGFNFVSNISSGATMDLVGGLEHVFSIQLGRIIPTNFHVFQRGGSTTNQWIFEGILGKF